MVPMAAGGGGRTAPACRWRGQWGEKVYGTTAKGDSILGVRMEQELTRDGPPQRYARAMGNR
jgi:hypothetical protein